MSLPEHDKQAGFFIELLRKKPADSIKETDQLYQAITDWMALPLKLSKENRDDILRLFSEKTGKSREQVAATFKILDLVPGTNGKAKDALSIRQILQSSMERARHEEEELFSILPSTGYFQDYALYTKNSEAPLAYHFWCSLAGLAATVNRRVYVDMGNHKLFPPFGIFLLGPSGVKKTTAGDQVISILRELATVPIYAEKLTPEALIDGMKENATGIVYAPEMVVLISKQKYMESIIPLLTRFMDSPDIWDSGTIMRGKVKLTDVGITCLMCSTIDWFTKNTPEALFGGGFIARNIMVLQDISPRIVPLPDPENLALRRKLVIQLANLAGLQGRMSLEPLARKAYETWYVENKLSRIAESDLFETYFARKHAHLLRLSMCLHLGTHEDLVICHDCVSRALRILEWTERQFSLLNDKMFRSSFGFDQDLVLRTIQRAGGRITHAELMRRMAFKLPGNQVKIIVSGLKEQGLLKEFYSTVSHFYELSGE